MWEEYEEVTIWSWIGFWFMALTSIAMVVCTVWMFL